MIDRNSYPYDGSEIAEEVNWGGPYTAHGWWPVFGLSVDHRGMITAHFAQTELVTNDSGGICETQLLGVDMDGSPGISMAEGIAVIDMPEFITERPEILGDVARELAQMAAVLAPLVNVLDMQQGREAIHSMIKSPDERVTALLAWTLLHLLVESDR